MADYEKSYDNEKKVVDVGVDGALHVLGAIALVVVNSHGLPSCIELVLLTTELSAI